MSRKDAKTLSFCVFGRNLKENHRLMVQHQFPFLIFNFGFSILFHFGNYRAVARSIASDRWRSETGIH